MIPDANVTNSLLSIFLSAAVPLRMMELVGRGGPTTDDMTRAQAASNLLGEKGDVLLFGSNRKGEAAYIANELAFSIAVLSFCPGGVRTFGQHFDASQFMQTPAPEEPE